MKDSFYLSPPFYSEYLKKLMRLKKEYPFLKLGSIGRSVQGRKIYALFLGNMCSPVVFAAAFHPLEWLTESLLVRFSEELCKNVCQSRELRCAVERRGIVIIPCVNPDGVELLLSRGASAGLYRPFTDKISGGDYRMWNSNIRGVDLNHNFDAGHDILRKMEIREGINGPALRRFGGLKPNSEPETRALVSLCRNFSVSRVYAFHSQGEEIFYKYGDRVPAGAECMAQMLSQASGYSLETQNGLASHGGFKDWFIKQFNCPGFTIEIGRGKNPLPISELSPIFARLYEMMILALVI